MTDKLTRLAEDWGYDDPINMLEDFIFDGVMPAICMNPDCDYATEMEPDQDFGWCDECCDNTMKSAAVLAGII